MDEKAFNVAGLEVMVENIKPMASIHFSLKKE